MKAEVMHFLILYTDLLTQVLAADVCEVKCHYMNDVLNYTGMRYNAGFGAFR